MIPAIVALASQKIRDHEARAELDDVDPETRAASRGFGLVANSDAVQVSTKREGNALHVAVCFVIPLDSATP